MQVLDKAVLSQLVGGIRDTKPIPRQGEGGDGDGGGGGGSGGGDSGGGSGAGGGLAVGGHEYDMAAVGVEGGAPAVVKISGVIPVFENPPPNNSVGQEPAGWEGSLVGVYVEPTLSVEHIAYDALLSGIVYNEASAFGEAAVAAALKKAGIAAKLPGPL